MTCFEVYSLFLMADDLIPNLTEMYFKNYDNQKMKSRIGSHTKQLAKVGKDKYINRKTAAFTRNNQVNQVKTKNTTHQNNATIHILQRREQSIC